MRLVTLPEQDVRLLSLPDEPVHGILAAPPCTFFCRMRMCRGKPTEAELLEGLSVVDACLRIILLCRPQWWALENPQGYLSKWLGEPVLKFDPYRYGDAWTKRTWVWGKFNPPQEVLFVRPLGRRVGGKRNDPAMVHGSQDNAQTPPGFAKAFFEANR